MNRIVLIKPQEYNFDEMHEQSVSQMSPDLANQLSQINDLKYMQKQPNDAFSLLTIDNAKSRLRPTYAGRRFLMTNEKKREADQIDGLLELQSNYSSYLNDYYKPSTDSQNRINKPIKNFSSNDQQFMHTTIRSPSPPNSYNQYSTRNNLREKQLAQIGHQADQENSRRYTNLLQHNSEGMNYKRANKQDFNLFPTNFQQAIGFVGTFRAGKYKRIQNVQKLPKESQIESSFKDNKNNGQNDTNSKIDSSSAKLNQYKNTTSQTFQSDFMQNYQPLYESKTLQVIKDAQQQNRKQLFSQDLKFIEYPHTDRLKEVEERYFKSTSEVSNNFIDQKTEENNFNSLQIKQLSGCQQPSEILNEQNQIIQSQCCEYDEQQHVNKQSQNCDEQEQLTIDKTAFEISFSQDIESISITPTSKIRNEQVFFKN